MTSTLASLNAGPALKVKPTPAMECPADAILGRAQSGREVIQDFVPLAESCEWQLGQEYLRGRGNKAFISDASPVPFVVNNDGTLSRNAARVFFASLEASGEGEGAPGEGEEIQVLELGIGVGLFARFFLDHFRELCLRHQRDYYDRLCYVAADRSERMLQDVSRHGVLANHVGRYRLRRMDAMQPEVGDQRSGPKNNRPFRAVFLNYLLDCLPAAVLEIDGDEVKQLCVRTIVGRNINLANHTDLTVEQLRQRAKSNDPAARRDLLEVYGLFASEYDYRKLERAKGAGVRGAIPYLDFALDYGRRFSRRLLHSYGAIQSLERLLELVDERGFILISDYGQTQLTRDDEFEHQRFSLATFVGLNFPLLKAYFERSEVSGEESEVGSQESGIRGQESEVGGQEPEVNGDASGSTVTADRSPVSWLEPNDEAGGIHSRLLGRSMPPEVRLAFQEQFGKAAHDRLQEPLVKARECVKVGRFELAAGFYRQALERQPANWVLLNEIAMFLTFQLRDPKAGADMAKLALELNPTCSADLWSTLGDALYECGRTAEARGAYRRALQINASDVRSRYNLAWVHTREKNFAAALEIIALAMALDKTGEYRDRLLQKQQEVLALLTQRNQQEYLLLINLVSRHGQSRHETGDKRQETEGIRMDGSG